MLYNRRGHASALFILLTSTTTRALYVPRSKIINVTTTTTTSRTTFVWSDQNQPFNPFNEVIDTLPSTCFSCPMSPKLLREIRIFAPAGEIAALSNNPEPRTLLCEYDTNESPCRYNSATGTLLVDQPSGDSCAHSASVSPECVKASSWSPSALLGGGGQNEPEAKTGPLAPSHEEIEQDWQVRDSVVSNMRKDAFEAIPNPAKPSSQHHFSALDATLRYADLKDDRNHKPLKLDSTTQPLPLPPSLHAPPTSPPTLDYDLDLDSTYDEERDDDITPDFEIMTTVPTVASHDHASDHNIALLFDLEFEDYSDAFKLSQEVMPTPGPARRPREQWTDSLDEKVAYIMGMTVGE